MESVRGADRVSYYRARYYDPSSGRFMREDPARLRAGSTDFYPYARNNPTNMVDPTGRLTINLGVTVNGQFGPVNVSGSVGIVIGSDASWGFYKTLGGGGGVGAGWFGGVTAGISTAKSICGFGGPFAETGESAGAGAGESVSVYTGLDSDGQTPVGGGSLTVGAGGGASVFAAGTYTKVTPVILGGKSACGCQ